MTTEELYGLNYPVKSLAIANPFVEKVLYKSSFILGQQMKPFCMYANDIQKQYGVIDMATFNGLLNTDISLLDEIADYRKNLFQNMGLYLDVTDPVQKKLLFYDYLLTIAICYIEIPKYRPNRDGYITHGYDKFFATRNPMLMATWMGLDPVQMQAKYSAQIQLSQAMLADNELRFVKCMSSSKGNKITVPRTAGDVTKMTCIPLFMLNALVDGVKPYLKDRIVEFTFIKDNNTVRVLPATVNEDILMEYYHDNDTVYSQLANTDLDKSQQGALIMSSKMARGYFKVPEVGLSRYDATGTRSVDVARLLSIKEVKEVNRYFIDVDLENVVPSFNQIIESKMLKHTEDLPLIYKDIVGKDPEDTMTTTDFISAIHNDVDAKSSLMTTKFKEDLHMYMLTHPQYFPNYTGIRLPTNAAPVAHPTNSFNLESEDISFG